MRSVASTHVYTYAAHNLTTTERATCLKDPRYLTWRMMTVKVAYDGTLTWYRTDSHWDVSSTIIGSTWGPGIAMSTHFASENDNNGTTDLGKTYVFAFGDGSGISLNHLAYTTTVPTSNTTAGTGTNNVVGSPTAFSSAHPNLY